MGLKKKLVLGVGTSVFCLLLAEGILRVAIPQPKSWMDIFRKHPSKPMFGLATNLDKFADTGESAWRVYTDEHGLRTTENGRAESSTPQILIIGDSFTFGYAVNYEESYPALLDATSGDDLQVINAGQPAYGPAQYRMHLEHLLSTGWRPESILLALYAGNDLFDVMINKDQPVVDGIIGNQPEFSIKQLLKRNSHLYRLATKTLHVLFQPSSHFNHTSIDLMKADYWDQEHIRNAYGIYKLELAKFKSICEENEIPLFVAIIPPTVSVDHCYGNVKAEPGIDYELPVRKFAAGCTELGIQFLDLTDALGTLPTSDTFLAFDGHFSAAGNRIVADALWESCPFFKDVAKHKPR